MTSRYLPRFADQQIERLLAELPAVLLVGPRASGKTTTARRHAETVLRLDDRRQAAAVDADPDAILRNAAEPVLVDEWQLAPAVLGGRQTGRRRRLAAGQVHHYQFGARQARTADLAGHRSVGQNLHDRAGCPRTTAR